MSTFGAKARWLFTMARRESRRGRFGLLSVFLAFVTSLAVLTALTTFSSRVSDTVDLHSKELLGADFVLVSRTRPSEEALKFLHSLPGLESQMVQTNTMLRADDGFRIAQVRGVSEPFPIYGKIISEPEVKDLNAGAVADTRLLDQLHLKIGDTLHLGTQELLILGKLVQVPGEVGSYGQVAPRVYVPLSQLEKSGLLTFGSQARYRYFYRESGDVKEILRKLRSQLSKYELDAESAEDREASVQRVTTSIGVYLKLAGLFAFLLGGLGLGLALRTFLQSKSASVQILRALGATRSESVGVFGVQILAVIVVATICGIGLGILILPLLGQLFGSLIPIQLTAFPALALLSELFFLSVVQSLAILLLPIFELRSEKPVSQLSYLLIPLILSGLTGILLLGHSKTVFVGLGACFVSVFLLMFIAFIFSKLVSSLTKGGLPYFIRFGLLQTTRRFKENSLIFISLGCAVAIVCISVELQGAIERQLRSTLSGTRPNLFLFDIQTDQLQRTKALIQEQHLSASEVVPVITMRLTKIGDADVRDLARTDRSQWVLKREYRTTYRDKTLGSEKILEGTFVSQAGNEPVPISLEKSIAKDLQVKLGDALTFDVHGVEIRTTVGSIREVDWKSGDVNFFVIFPPGVLEDAPQYFAMLARYDTAAQLSAFEGALNRLFPNVSVIDVAELFKGIESILREFGSIAEVLGAAIGIITVMILLSSMIGSLFQRARSDALLRAVGGTSAFIRRSRAVELGAIVLIGGLTGSALGFAVSAVLIEQTLDLQLSTNWSRLALLEMPLIVLPLVIGWLATFRTSRRSTLAVLRSD